MQEGEAGRLERLTVAGVEHQGAQGVYLHAELGSHLVAEIAVVIPAQRGIDRHQFILLPTRARAPQWNVSLGVDGGSCATGVEPRETLSVIEELSMVILTSEYPGNRARRQIERTATHQPFDGFRMTGVGVVLVLKELRGVRASAARERIERGRRIGVVQCGLQTRVVSVVVEIRVAVDIGVVRQLARFPYRNFITPVRTQLA